MEDALVLRPREQRYAIPYARMQLPLKTMTICNKGSNPLSGYPQTVVLIHEQLKTEIKRNSFNRELFVFATVLKQTPLETLS